MACPFGVLRYHPDALSSTQRPIALKCDNCVHRQAQGLLPACVEICKSGALSFEEEDEALKRETDRITRLTLSEQDSHTGAQGFELLRQMRRAAAEVGRG